MREPGEPGYFLTPWKGSGQTPELPSPGGASSRSNHASRKDALWSENTEPGPYLEPEILSVFELSAPFLADALRSLSYCWTIGFAFLLCGTLGFLVPSCWSRVKESAALNGYWRTDC